MGLYGNLGLGFGGAIGYAVGNAYDSCKKQNNSSKNNKKRKLLKDEYGRELDYNGNPIKKSKRK